jgi:AcrR family transcriptional regulator
MGRRERRSFETRERLFRSAMNLFRDRGFQHTTVEDITNAADVGKGTFFNYFPSKEHVLGVLGEVQSAKYDKFMLLAREQNTREALRWLYHALPSEVGSSPKMVRSMLTVFLTSEAVREFLTEGLARARGKLVTMFEEAQRRAEIPNHFRAEDLAFRFQQSLFGSMLLWTLQTPTPPLEMWLNQGFSFFWAAVTAPAQVQVKE